jgi:hypothetical protein
MQNRHADSDGDPKALLPLKRQPGDAAPAAIISPGVTAVIHCGHETTPSERPVLCGHDVTDAPFGVQRRRFSSL